MPTAFWIVLLISLLALAGAGSRGARIAMSLFVPFVCVLGWWLINAFSEPDYALTPKWLIDAVVMWVPAALLCLGLVLLRPAQPGKGGEGEG